MRNLEDWYPQCIHTEKPKGYSVSGHVLPCCWADNDDPGFEPLRRRHLQIENNESLDCVFASREWQEFAHNLVEEPKKAPSTCWKYCGKGREHKIKALLRD